MTFTVEWSTSKGNGDTGVITPPHLGSKTTNPLKDYYYLNEVYKYARANLPRNHDLIKVKQWHLHS